MTQEPFQNKRTSSVEAVRVVLECLRENPSSPVTIQELSRKTNINRRTVEKAVEVLKYVNANLSDADFVTFRNGRAHFVEVKASQMKHEIGLLDLPEAVQRLILRTAYFPAPSVEESLLIHLLLAGAESEDLAVKIDSNPIVAKLLNQENIARTSTKRYYLTEIGRNVAKGALAIYPELESIAKGTIEAETRGREGVVVGLTLPMRTGDGRLPPGSVPVARFLGSPPAIASINRRMEEDLKFTSKTALLVEAATLAEGKGDFPGAEANLAKAADLFKEHRNAAACASVYNRLGEILTKAGEEAYIEGNYEKASKIFKRASAALSESLQLFERLGPSYSTEIIKQEISNIKTKQMALA